ncbi:hypothetical protein ACQJBY_028389 [Aegilops geniculata]
MRAATTPSRRERASPPPVRLKIEQVFTPANTHHHRTPHPIDHAAHTAMATGQHLTTGSAQEHRGATTRAAALASKTWTPPHSRPTTTPTKDTSGKEPPFAPLGCPQRQNPEAGQNWPPSTRAIAGRETSTVLQPGARRARSCCRARDERGPAAGRETSDGPKLGRAEPSTEVATSQRGEGRRSKRAA